MEEVFGRAYSPFSRIDSGHGAETSLVRQDGRRSGGIHHAASTSCRPARASVSYLSATYELMNVFGSPRAPGSACRAATPLPDAPVGHDWAVVEEHPENC
jgi:hypothetical protein